MASFFSHSVSRGALNAFTLSAASVITPFLIASKGNNESEHFK
jgi:hypothetical protein